MKYSQKGFTFIEIMVVLTIIVLLVGVSVPSYFYFQGSSVLQISKDEALQQLYHARLLARSGQGDSNYGVYFQEDGYTVYRGDSYDLRDAFYDIVMNFPEQVTVQSGVDARFLQNSGLPLSAYQIVLEGLNSDETINIIINEEGLMY